MSDTSYQRGLVGLDVVCEEIITMPLLSAPFQCQRWFHI